MIFDVETVERSAFDRDFDVCVIGAGPAGITLARRLAARGFEVALMEGGGLEWSEESQALAAGESVGLVYTDLDVVRGEYLDRVHLGLDYFDASINRVAAWVIGARNLLRALLMALLEPIATLREREAAGDLTARLALLEELKTLPHGAVWDY